MLRVPAFQICHPLLFVILVITNYFSLHKLSWLKRHCTRAPFSSQQHPDSQLALYGTCHPLSSEQVDGNAAPGVAPGSNHHPVTQLTSRW